MESNLERQLRDEQDFESSSFEASIIVNQISDILDCDAALAARLQLEWNSMNERSFDVATMSMSEDKMTFDIDAPDSLLNKLQEECSLHIKCTKEESNESFNGSEDIYTFIEKSRSKTDADSRQWPASNSISLFSEQKEQCVDTYAYSFHDQSVVDSDYVLAAKLHAEWNGDSGISEHHTIQTSQDSPDGNMYDSDAALAAEIQAEWKSSSSYNVRNERNMSLRSYDYSVSNFQDENVLDTDNALATKVQAKWDRRTLQKASSEDRSDMSSSLLKDARIIIVSSENDNDSPETSSNSSSILTHPDIRFNSDPMKQSELQLERNSSYQSDETDVDLVLCIIALAEDEEKRQRDEQCHSDLLKAIEIQQLEEFETSKKALFEENEMNTTATGRSIILVKRLLRTVQSVISHYPDLFKECKATKTIAPFMTHDDMIVWATRFIETYETYQSLGYKANELNIEIGYHYTAQQNLKSIRTHGLLCKSDQQKNHVTTHSSCSHDSNDCKHSSALQHQGIATCNNPFAFLTKSDSVGLIVATIKGKIMHEATQKTDSDKEQQPAMRRRSSAQINDTDQEEQPVIRRRSSAQKTDIDKEQQPRRRHFIITGMKEKVKLRRTNKQNEGPGAYFCAVDSSTPSTYQTSNFNTIRRSTSTMSEKATSKNNKLPFFAKKRLNMEENDDTKIQVLKYYDTDIALQSSQCLPIVAYNSNVIMLSVLDNTSSSSSFTNQGNCCVIELQEELQKVLNDFFITEDDTTSKDINIVIDQTTSSTTIYPIPFDVIYKLPSYILSSNNQNCKETIKKNTVSKTRITANPEIKDNTYVFLEIIHKVVLQERRHSNSKRVLPDLLDNGEQRMERSWDSSRTCGVNENNANQIVPKFIYFNMTMNENESKY